jgi:hypothetical protein
MSSDDIAYYRARAADERERANQAKSESIAQIHLDLADKYEALADEAAATSRQRSDWGGPQTA